MNVKPRVSPQEAWKPIDASSWTEDNIRHLLRRASWTARPVDTRRLESVGHEGAVDYLFKQASYPDPHPVIEQYADKVDAGLADEWSDSIAWAKTQPRWKESAAKVKEPNFRDPHARRIAIAYHGEQRNKARNSGTNLPQFEGRFGQAESWTQYAHEWLKTANRSQNAAFEKLNLFLQNILVVNRDSLRSNPDYLVHIHNHHRVLRDNFFGDYPAICKKMYKTTGMGFMLDVIGSTKTRPNENFARELQELFVLGVDNGYTEDDIKEACKAFTGYAPDPDLNPYTLKKGDEELVLNLSQHNQDRKRVYGRSRDYNGDDIVDLVFTKEGAETHVPRLLTHHFLIENGLPDEYLVPLGRAWRDANFNFYWLISKFFNSKIFYDPVFRGQIFKSPFQFYLGLLNDLGLQVEPTIEIVRELDFLGQPFADPPDVNGWDGGAFWMNNGTINARRVIVDRLFSGSFRRGMKGATSGTGNYVVQDETIRSFIQSSDKSAEEMVDHFVTYFIPLKPNDEYITPLWEHIGRAGSEDEMVTALKQIILAILQSQYYQVC